MSLDRAAREPAVSRPALVLAMSPSNLPRLLDDTLLARLAAVADFDPNLVLDDLTTATAKRALADAEVLLTCWGCPRVDADVLAAAPRLRAIVHGAGTVKGLVGPACWQRGVVVSSAAAANAVPVAEFTVAMIVLANKYVLPIAAAYHADAQRRDWVATYPALGGYGKTVGIIGASRVGRRVVELLRAYDLDVVLADPTVDADAASRLGVRLVELDELLVASDVVSIHAPDIPATRNLLPSRLSIRKNEGHVFETQPGSRMRMPGTRAPSSANAMA